MFLTLDDYKKFIDPAVLTEILNSDDTLRTDQELISKSLIISYLNNRFDTDAMFPDWILWSYTSSSFVVDDFVLLYADDFVAGNYNEHDLVTWTDGLVYRCIADTAGEDPTDAGFWTAEAENYTFYTALDTVPANTSITNLTYWSEGDTRYPVLVAKMIDMVLYDLHSRISPRQIPDLRIYRNKDAIKYFQDLASPRKNMEPPFPLKAITQPDEYTQGYDTSYGSVTKKDNGQGIF